MKNLIIMIVCLSSLFFSCKKENEMKISQTDANKSSTSRVSSTNSAAAVATYTEYPVSPNFGKPNSTYYYFKVAGTNSLALSVKLFARTSGLITYIPMSYSGGYWMLSTKIMTNDWYDWRYVYTATNGNISTTTYTLCNTYNTFDATGTSHIRWPFGADGSSWNNKTTTVNGVQQQWLRGNAGGGNDTAQGTHTGFTERYAVDWNRRKLVNWSTNDDFGTELRSPLDGEILDFGSYSTSCCGNSKFVSVIQTAPNGTVYRFFFGHLDSYPSYFQKKTSSQNGTPVRAGYTILGNLGSTGATSPHAHCSMRKHSNDESVKFEFDAQ